MEDTKTEDATATYSPPSVPTRVILRMRVKDFDNESYSWFDSESAVEAYLSWAKRPLSEYQERKHGIFVELHQDLEVQQKWFHVLLDLNALLFEVKNMNEVHHEIYEVKRDGPDLTILQAKRPEVAQNLIKKIRYFADRSFPWNTDKWHPAINK